MKSHAPTNTEVRPDDKFAVLVVYEDRITHERVRELCDHLLERFWGEMEFDFNWWSFELLRDPAKANEAALTAAQARVVMVAAHAGPRLPARIEEWFESWAPRRQQRDGVLAALVGLPEEQGALPIVTYLQRIAGRAQMDFLPQLTASQATQQREPPPESLTSSSLITKTLKKMLDPKSPPSHWGINE